MAVYQVVDAELYTRGLFSSEALARDAVAELTRDDAAGYWQVHRVPLDTLGHFGRRFLFFFFEEPRLTLDDHVF